MQSRSSSRIRSGNGSLPSLGSPGELIEALQTRRPEAREQLWQQIRPLLERLIDQLIDQHRLTTSRARLLTLALHAAETWLRTRPTGDFAQAGWSAFRAAVLLHVGKVTLRPFARQSSPVAPGHDPNQLPDHPLYQARTYSLPHDQIGDDWFGGDWVGGGQAADGSFWVLLADITGHGYHAYLLASTLPSVWQKCWPATGPHGEPVDLLVAMHQLFEDCFPEGVYVECTLVRLTGDGTVTVVPAGGTRLLVRRRGQGQADLVKLRGAWLGLFPPSAADQHTYVLNQGDELILGTDGLFEQLGAGQPLDGTLQTAAGGSFFDEVRTLLAEALRQHDQTDDITMVALRRRSAGDLPAEADGTANPIERGNVRV